MSLGVREWRKNKNSVSVDYGPLTFSLAITERYDKRDSKETAQADARWQPGADATRWPAYEIHPASDWNYGLVLDDADPASSFSVVHKSWPTEGNPFTPDAAPIELRARGRRLPQWGIDEHGLCAVLPQSPVASTEPVEPLRLIPMGAARLRISAFPVIAE
jgi:hypothetical protein